MGHVSDMRRVGDMSDDVSSASENLAGRKASLIKVASPCRQKMSATFRHIGDIPTCRRHALGLGTHRHPSAGCIDRP